MSDLDWPGKIVGTFACRTAARASNTVRVGLRAKIALAMVAISVISMLSLMLYMYRSVDLLTERDLTRLSRNLGVTASQLGTVMDSYRKDTLFLVKTPPIMGIYRAQSAGGVDPADGSTEILWRDRLATIFTGLLAARPEYIQARFISAADNGREIVRVERLISGAIETTPAPRLQSKGDRPYFVETAKLGSGEVYFSDVDLNREFGRIEEPHRPVLRTATPVRNENGDFLGIVILNIDFRFLLETTGREIPDSHFYYVANSAGDYLHHPLESREFGFDLGQRHLIQTEYPPLADVVAGVVSGFSGTVNQSDGDHLAVAETVFFDPADASQRLILAVVAKKAGLPAEASDLRNGALAAGGILLLLSVVAIVWLVDLIVRPLSTMMEKASAVAAGDRNIDVAMLGRRQDEIGDLARSFATMTGEVARRENELVAQKNALAESEALFRETVEFAPDVLLIVDSDGMIVLANSMTESVFGYRQQELVGMEVEVLVPMASRSQHRVWRTQYAQAPTRRNMRSDLNIAGRTKDGRLIPVEVSLGPATLQGEAVILAIIRDVSERRELEGRLSDYAKELERSNAELSQFAYIASHDLQEPLRMVDSYVNLLARRYRGKLDDEADEFIGFATDGARRMKQLINDLLDYSRVSNRPLKVEQTDIGMVVSRAIDLLRDRIAEAGAELTVGTMPTLLVDPVQIERLFVNLIGNAVKYRGPDKPKIAVDAEKKGGMWQFSVSDNGIGIESRFREKVFEIFTRLHGREEYEGTGVGLASCKRIVERHGGNIWVDTSDSGGSVFRFTLAVAQKGDQCHAP